MDRKIPSVTIILLNYNGAEDTILCLESLKNIVYIQYKIVIVDNNSNDNSLLTIETYLKLKDYNDFIIFTSPMQAMENQGKQKKITLLETGHNGGYGHGNNIGIKYALKNDVDYILLLNNDTVVDSNFLEPLIQMCEEDKNIGIASGQIFFEDRPDVFWFNGGTYNNCTGKLKHIDYNTINNGQTPPPKITFITGCLWLIPKYVFARVGYINEEYFMYVEDLEFSKRVLDAGYKLKVSNKSHIFHKVGGSSGGEITSFSMYWRTKNIIKFMKSNVLFLCWPLYLFNNVFSFSLKYLVLGRINILKVQMNAIFDLIRKK